MKPSNLVDWTTLAMRRVSLEIKLLHVLHDARLDFAYSAFHPLGGAGVSAIAATSNSQFVSRTDTNLKGENEIRRISQKVDKGAHGTLFLSLD